MVCFTTGLDAADGVGSFDDTLGVLVDCPIAVFLVLQTLTAGGGAVCRVDTGVGAGVPFAGFSVPFSLDLARQLPSSSNSPLIVGLLTAVDVDGVSAVKIGEATDAGPVVEPLATVEPLREGEVGVTGAAAVTLGLEVDSGLG